MNQWDDSTGRPRRGLRRREERDSEFERVARPVPGHVRDGQEVRARRQRDREALAEDSEGVVRVERERAGRGEHREDVADVPGVRAEAAEHVGDAVGGREEAGGAFGQNDEAEVLRFGRRRRLGHDRRRRGRRRGRGGGRLGRERGGFGDHRRRRRHGFLVLHELERREPVPRRDREHDRVGHVRGGRVEGAGDARHPRGQRPKVEALEREVDAQDGLVEGRNATDGRERRAHGDPREPAARRHRDLEPAGEQHVVVRKEDHLLRPN
mmetsp:Transcript_42/g.152  ORF Transcript_42/g.152 Transcript_42/m.152 type:complete len:267 (+) Transcript_42:1094-1894(+)